MSFLAGRLASSEGAYFLQESKQAVTKILQKQPKNVITKSDPTPIQSEIASADVLPEVLRHSLPPKIFNSSSEISNTSSFSKSSKWALEQDPDSKIRSFASREAINPLRAYASLPQVTFGAKRWQLPDAKNSVVASTANDLRQDKQRATINPEKLKAVAAGLSQRMNYDYFNQVIVGAAFAIATALVFGGGSLILALVVSKLEVHSTSDIRTKGKDLVQPRFETFRERLAPVRSWAEDVSKKWHFEKDESVRDNRLLKELARTLGSKTSS